MAAKSYVIVIDYGNDQRFWTRSGIWTRDNGLAAWFTKAAGAKHVAALRPLVGNTVRLMKAAA